jgi:hypothetical protein
MHILHEALGSGSGVILKCFNKDLNNVNTMIMLILPKVFSKQKIPFMVMPKYLYKAAKQ